MSRTEHMYGCTWSYVVSRHRLFKSVFDWGFQSEDEKFVSSDGIYLCRGKVGLSVVATCGWGGSCKLSDADEHGVVVLLVLHVCNALT